MFHQHAHSAGSEVYLFVSIPSILRSLENSRSRLVSRFLSSAQLNEEAGTDSMPHGHFQFFSVVIVTRCATNFLSCQCCQKFSFAFTHL